MSDELPILSARDTAQAVGGVENRNPADTKLYPVPGQGIQKEQIDATNLLPVIEVKHLTAAPTLKSWLDSQEGKPFCREHEPIIQALKNARNNGAPINLNVNPDGYYDRAYSGANGNMVEIADFKRLLDAGMPLGDVLLVTKLVCFSGNTEVSLLDGTERRMNEIVGEEHWFYSYHEDRVIPTQGQVVKTGRRELLEVELDNDEKLRGTEDHEWMLRDGSYRRTDQLQPDDSLMPHLRSERHKKRSSSAATLLATWINWRKKSGFTKDEFSFDRFREERPDLLVLMNHKVVAVRQTGIVEDTYCVWVNHECHNFALSAGVFVHNCGPNGVCGNPGPCTMCQDIRDGCYTDVAFRQEDGAVPDLLTVGDALDEEINLLVAAGREYRLHGNRIVNMENSKSAGVPEVKNLCRQTGNGVIYVLEMLGVYRQTEAASHTALKRGDLGGH